MVGALCPAFDYLIHYLPAFKAGRFHTALRRSKKFKNTEDQNKGEIHPLKDTDMKIQKFVYFMLAATLLCSCGNEADQADSAGGDTVPLSIADASLAVSMLRAATTLNTDGISMGVFLVAGNGYSARSNVKYLYSTSGTAGWAVNGTTDIYLNKNAAALCAYYPYDAAANTLTRTLTPAVYSTASDLCYKNGLSANSTAGSLSVEMGHAYSRLTLNISKGTYPGTGLISSISIANAGLITNSTLNISTGSFTTVTTGGSYTDAAPAIANLSATATKQYLMVPSTLSGITTLTLKIDGGDFVGSIPNATLSALVAGSNLTLTISLTGTAFVISSVTTTDWVDGPNSPVLPIKTSNCYLLAPNSSTTIPVNIKGNGNASSAVLGGLSPIHTAASVGIVWQTTTGLITCSNFSAINQTVDIAAGNTSGNAVVAAYAADGTTILWSWHIWVTTYNPDYQQNGTTYSYTPTAGVTNVFMDRNLGALTTTYTNDANILHYQWGRKDPFPAAAVVKAGTSTSVDVTTTTSQSMLFSSQNPFKFISNSSSTYDWCSTPSNYYWMGTGGTITAPGAKTIYDPCPSGWRVPAYRSGVSPWNGLSTTGATWGSGTATGYTWPGIGFWPAAGFRSNDSGALNYVGSIGYDWSASPSSSDGCSLNFGSGGVYPTDYYHRVNGFTIRCVQEW